MSNNRDTEKLEEIVGKGNVLTQMVDMMTYSYDATADMPHQLPDMVVFPSNTEQVQKIVNFARENHLALYPRGAGTNLSGGCVPLTQGIVLSFQHMDK
ncbi:MAG TPA: FAD-binding oxidoreductase, partial [Nitrospirota bacterium]|nr:FAD-binding oxidoreductase [Nitrospirota bacterium]